LIRHGISKSFLNPCITAPKNALPTRQLIADYCCKHSFDFYNKGSKIKKTAIKVAGIPGIMAASPART